MYVCARHPCPVLSGPEESVRFPGLDLQMVVSYCEHTENQAWDLWKNSDLQLKHLVLIPQCKVIFWTYKICLKCICFTCNKSILNIIKTNLLISPFLCPCQAFPPFLKMWYPYRQFKQKLYHHWFSLHLQCSLSMGKKLISEIHF